MNWSFGNNSAPVSSINLASINPNSAFERNFPQNDDSDYDMSVMAQVILDRDSLEFTPLNMSDLEVVVDAARTTIENSVSQDSALAELFRDPRLKHRSIIDASIRVRSLQKDMQNHLAALQGLSSESEASVIQTVLRRVERAISATSLDLRKQAKRDAVHQEVAEVNAVLEDVKNLVAIWRETYADNSPLRLDNTGAASDIVLDYTTATLVAYTLALTLRLLEGVGRTASSFILKGMKIFGM
ncbi:hypothetical protein F5877DRAFT_86965, partial [Lentinula edodes]